VELPVNSIVFGQCRRNMNRKSHAKPRRRREGEMQQKEGGWRKAEQILKGFGRSFGF
jgi:hypothetical protein